MVNHYCKNNKLPYKKRRTLCSLGIGFVFFGFLFLFTKYSKMPLCIFKMIFDIPCPGCGLTRGFISILHLDFVEAMEYHVLSVPLFVSICVYALVALLDVFLNRNNIEKIERQLAKPYMYFVYIIIVVMSYVFNHFLDALF